MQNFFRKSAVELKRLESSTQACMVALFKEVSEGAPTIRAFKENGRFEKRLADAMDQNSLAFLCFESCQRWLGLHLDFLGALLVFVNLILNLVLSSTYQEKEQAAAAHSQTRLL